MEYAGCGPLALWGCCSPHRIPIAGGGGPGGAGALGAQRQQGGVGRAEPWHWAHLVGGVRLEQESAGAGAAEEVLFCPSLQSGWPCFNGTLAGWARCGCARSPSSSTLPRREG